MKSTKTIKKPIRRKPETDRQPFAGKEVEHSFFQASNEMIQHKPFFDSTNASEENEKQSPAADNLQEHLNQSEGTGAPIPEDTQVSMASAFGTSFSDVRIHKDQNAEDMNETLNAQAFTNGKNIFFNQGKYNPNSSAGKHLLAHELTHTMQQSANGSPQSGTIQKQDKKPAKPKPKPKPKKGTAASAQKLTFLPSKNGTACACIIVVHNDEKNARKTAQLIHENCAYNLILLEPEHSGREIKIPKNGSVDPNSLFPGGVANRCLGDEKECLTFLKDKKDSKDKKEILKYVQMQFFLTVKKDSNNFSLPVVALHNNSIGDTSGYRKSKKDKSDFKGTSIDKTTKDKGKAQLDKLKKKLDKRFGSKIKNKLDTPKKTNIYRWCIADDLEKCYIGDPEHPDRVVWVTNKKDFKKLKGKNINVVIQDKDSAKPTAGKSESKGDLSTLFILLENISDQAKKDKPTVEKGIDKDIDDVKNIFKIMLDNVISDPGKLPENLKGLLFEVVNILGGLGQLMTLNNKSLDPVKLRYINIETPIDRIQDQTDAGRKGSFMFIAETLKAAGLYCCGTDPKEAEKKIKSGLEKKNIK